MLFYKVVEGSLEEPENLVIECQDLYLRDIGNAGHTSWENDESVIKIYSDKPELMKCRSGLIHSHHNMEAYFSNEDQEELEDNSVGIDYYLSLIVNNNTYEDWVAKIAIQGKEEVTVKRSFMGKLQELFGREEVQERAVLFNYNMDIDVTLGEALADIVNNVKEVEASGVSDSRRKNYSSQYNRSYQNDNSIGFQTGLFQAGYDPFEEGEDNELDAFHASLFMGMPGVVNSLKTVVERMTKHLKSRSQYSKFAKQKLLNADEVIEKKFDSVTPRFKIELLEGFVDSLLALEFVPNSNEAYLVNEMVEAFNAVFTEDTDIP